MEVMLEEEVVRERARRVIPADGTEKGRRALIFQSRCAETRCSVGTLTYADATTTKVLTMQTVLKIYGN